MEQSSFFDRTIADPLASRMRPRTLDEFAGQEHLLGPGKVLRALIDGDRISYSSSTPSPRRKSSVCCKRRSPTRAASAGRISARRTGRCR